MRITEERLPWSNQAYVGVEGAEIAIEAEDPQEATTDKARGHESASRRKEAKVATRAHTRKARVTAVAGAVLAALAVWALAEGVFGVDVRAPGNGGQANYDVGPALVAVTSALAALAGWGLLAALEHFAARALAIWTAVASLVLVGSLAGPLSGSGIIGANRATLLAMHVAVGAELIPGMHRTARNEVASEDPARPVPGRRGWVASEGTSRLKMSGFTAAEIECGLETSGRRSRAGMEALQVAGECLERTAGACGALRSYR